MNPTCPLENMLSTPNQANGIALCIGWLHSIKYPAILRHATQISRQNSCRYPIYTHIFYIYIIIISIYVYINIGCVYCHLFHMAKHTDDYTHDIITENGTWITLHELFAKIIRTWRGPCHFPKSMFYNFNNEHICSCKSNSKTNVRTLKSKLIFIWMCRATFCDN